MKQSINKNDVQLGSQIAFGVDSSVVTALKNLEKKLTPSSDTSAKGIFISAIHKRIPKSDKDDLLQKVNTAIHRIAFNMSVYNRGVISKTSKYRGFALGVKFTKDGSSIKFRKADINVPQGVLGNFWAAFMPKVIAVIVRQNIDDASEFGQFVKKNQWLWKYNKIPALLLSNDGKQSAVILP